MLSGDAVAEGDDAVQRDCEDKGEAATEVRGSSGRGRYQQVGEAQAVGCGTSGAWRKLRWGRTEKVGSDDGSCSRPAKVLWRARRQRILETAPQAG